MKKRCIMNQVYKEDAKKYGPKMINEVDDDKDVF